MNWKKTCTNLIILIMITILFLPAAALGEMTDELLLGVQMLGFEDVESAMAAYGVETEAELVAILTEMYADEAAAYEQAEEESTTDDELLLGVQMLGFEDVESAMAAYGVETEAELVAILTEMYAAEAAAYEQTEEETAEPEEEEAAEETEERTFDGKVLATMEMEASAEEIYTFFTELLGIPIEDFICYPTIAEALMALKTGKVDTLLSMDANATYMAESDDTLYLYMDPRLAEYNDISFSMVVMNTNEALCAELNEAIAYLTENGVLEALTVEMIKGTTTEVSEYEAEKTLYVGVTGDIPPIDYVDESGTPIGFNVSLMSQIGAYLGYEIEFVQLSKNAMMTALASGKIDVVFWQEQSLSPEMLELLGVGSDQILTTDPYLILSITAIELK